MTARRATLRLLLLLALAIASIGCDRPKTPDLTPSDGSVVLDRFRIVATSRQLKISALDGRVLLATPFDASRPGSPSLAWRQASVEVTFAVGAFLFDETAQPWQSAPSLEVAPSKDNETIELRAGGLRGTIRRVAPGILRLSWRADDASASRVIQSFYCDAEEAFFGTGARVHGTEHRGETIPNWVSEQGVGKRRKTDPHEYFPLIGDVHDSYLPVPFMLSSRGYGVLIDAPQRSIFRFCTSEASDRWSIEVWHDQLDLYLIDGPTPLDVVSRLTTLTGRPAILPRWAFAPWFDALHGPEEVLKVAEQIRANKIPGSLIWTEDWIGAVTNAFGYHLTYQWTPDTTLYPDLAGLTASLHERGFKFLVYFNSFIEKGLAQWDEALRDGHTIKDADGNALIFDGVFLQDTTLPDLTQPDTVAWMKSFMAAALDLGVDGWMADYAEWLPTSARFADGRSGFDVHNLYPLLWQRANREILDAKRPDGDYLYFVRSGWSGTGGLAQVVWAGDQQTEFGGLDGFQSVIPLIVNSGLSGIPIMTHDIGGYSSIAVRPCTRELYFRWAALGAWSSIMRTHHGALDKKNWGWNEDDETIAMFRRHAKTHMSLFPYRYSLARDAHELGWPMMRHLLLDFPKDRNVYRVADQFMLGPAFLVAPVVEDGARERSVYLPAGRWYAFESDGRYQGGTTYVVSAALDEIPVFVRAGSLVPALRQVPDTLAPATVAGVTDGRQLDAAALILRVYLGAAGRFRLYDDSTFRLGYESDPSQTPTIVVDQQTLPLCADAMSRSCVVVDGLRKLTIRLQKTNRSNLVGVEGTTARFSLTIENSVAREVDVQVRW